MFVVFHRGKTVFYSLRLITPMIRCKSRTLKTADEDCIAFEVKDSDVSWTQYKTNEWVLGKSGVTRDFLAGRLKDQFTRLLCTRDMKASDLCSERTQ